jgi:hypothetical protein
MQFNSVKVRAKDCTYPAIGALLPEYIIESLEESIAEKVEGHLSECQHCRDRYVTVLKVRRAARRKRIESVLGKPPAVRRTDRQRGALRKINGNVESNGHARLPAADEVDEAEEIDAVDLEKQQA